MRLAAVCLMAGVWTAGCTGAGPDGSCVTDYDCEPEQLCGTRGTCLLCTNCDRGRVGTCTAPAWPFPDPPDEIRIESREDRDMLFYLYHCEGGASSYRHDRLADQTCFDPAPRVDDGCGLGP